MAFYAQRELHLQSGITRQLRFGILAAITIFSAGVFAAPPEVERAFQDSQRQQQIELQRQQEQFIKDRSSAAPPARLPVPEVAAPTAEQGACVTVREIHVDGVTLLPAEVINQIVARYLNRCLGVSDIESLLADITRAYVDKGWIMVRAYLPQQDLGGGSLKIVVIEGRVSEVLVEDGDKHSISLGNTAPSLEGRALNLRDIEQALDQINRLASNNATVDTLPGKEPGDTRVVLRNEPTTPLHGYLSLDNQGSATTGKNQGGVTISVDNPLQFNDFVSYTHRESIPLRVTGKQSQSDALTYVLPLGYTTLSINLNKSNYVSQFAIEGGDVFFNSGESTNSTLRLDRVLFRDAMTRWTAYGSLTIKDTKSYLEDIFLEGTSRSLTVMDAGVNVSSGFLGGALLLDLGVSQGLTYGGALHDADNLTSRDPRAQFTRMNFSGSYYLPFKLAEQDFQFSSRWAGQYSRDVLYGSEQLLIGSIYTVRGFANTSLSDDNGFYMRNEIGLRRPFSAGGLSGSARPWIGFDYGRALSNNKGVPEGTLTGLALGVQANLTGGVSLDLFAAAPLTKPDFMKREPARVWVQLGLSL
jgi:hemolysin activation/secretion protein